MTFREYIASRIPTEGEFDTIIGGVDMPATVCLSADMKFPTARMEAKYGALLDAVVDILDNDVVEVLHDDYNLGERFCMELAGWCDCEEYTALTGLE